MGEKTLFMKKRSKLFWIILFVILSGIIGGLLIRFIKSEGEIAGIKILRIVTKPPGDLVFMDPVTGAPRKNLVILVLGLDENRDERGIMHHKGSRTDTIFLLGLDNKARKLGVLSIPRDTWVWISEKYGHNRINTAYTEAFWEEYDRTENDYEKAKTAGINQARETIGTFLGVEVDHVVLLKIKAAEELVDSIGGITVDVEKDMNYDDYWGHLHIHLEKGPQRLNGEQAVGYARFRHDEEGDWGRIRRQHQVVAALVNELKKPAHIMHVDRIAQVIKRNIETDLDVNQLIDLARVYMEFDRDNIFKGVVMGEDEIIEGNMVLIPLEETKSRMTERLLMDPEMLPADEIWIRVLNGCGIPGLGARTARLLRKEGYTVVEVGNAQETNLEQTVIHDHFLNQTVTVRIGRILNLKEPRVSHHHYQENGNGNAYENGDSTLDFTIILGRDMREALMILEDDDDPDPDTDYDPENQNQDGREDNRHYEFDED